MNPFKIFKLKPEERIQAGVMLLVIVVLNGLFIWRMHDLFLQEGFGPYWKVFERELHLSGYDPLTYLGITDYDLAFLVAESGIDGFAGRELRAVSRSPACHRGFVLLLHLYI